MSSIGPVNFDIMRGVPSLIRPRVETWEVPGLDGYGAQTLGNGDAEFELETVAYFTSNALADLHIVACVEVQGTVVTIVDDYGASFPAIIVVRVDTARAKMPVIHKGNANAVRVRIGWRMLANV